jgi:hypothetical protein
MVLFGNLIFLGLFFKSYLQDLICKKSKKGNDISWLLLLLFILLLSLHTLSKNFPLIMQQDLQRGQRVKDQKGQ